MSTSAEFIPSPIHVARAECFDVKPKIFDRVEEIVEKIRLAIREYLSFAA